MTALIVIGIILLIFILIAVTRITVSIAYDEKFKAVVSVLGFTVYSTETPKDKNAEKSKPRLKKSPEEKKDNIFKIIYRKKGLKYTVDLVNDAVKTVLSKLLWFVRRLKLRNFALSLSVVGSDAADTAIKYGAICSAVYPTVAFVDTNLNFKPKKIDIYADFDSKDISFKISTDIKAEVFILIILAIGLFYEYLKIKNRVEADLNSVNRETNNNSVKDVL